MKEIGTYEIKICLGLKEGYDGKQHQISEVYQVCKSFCDDIGFAVTVTPTMFIYTKGMEKGCFVGIIQYPRFPHEIDYLRDMTFRLAYILMKKFNQLRLSIIFPDKTVMLEREEEIS